jgi:hypothetical protein
MWWLLLLTTAVYAQREDELKAIRSLKDELPEYDIQESLKGSSTGFRSRGYRPPQRKISYTEIKASGTGKGAIPKNAPLIRLSDNTIVQIPELIYVDFYRLQDELGFKYLINKTGEVVYKVSGELVSDIKHELALYEPPLRYTPAPKNIVRAEYDRELKLIPEASFYAGLVSGDYMRDLFNDTAARFGISNQYGAHLFTKWRLPIKTGAVIHYEKTGYRLENGGKLTYSALSFGPQFKTKTFDIYGEPFLFQCQFRVSPFARAQAELPNNNLTFKFNSADLLLAAEHPVPNFLGVMSVGLYYQSQWLNIKDQPEFVSINATNETNQSFGLYLSQAFDL